ncbi:hypothetical protein [Ferrimonas sp. YFM]|uniref:hypothetical protein n=1 Tax=Ferrimonas sp. YFM TaxID=3028878 RepID=UPI0025723FE9|nr:hypothetical protein [Ferrimonas sp. YFM]BDY04755.1 hypothetical protein F0521_17960 [Ferrimonas sp. YFM]
MPRNDLALELRALLKRACTDLGVAELCFCYDICSPEQWRARLKGRQAHLKSFAKRRQLYASSDQAMSLWLRKSNCLAADGQGLFGLFQQRVYVWPESLLPAAVQRQMKKNGLAALVTLSFPCRDAEQLCGRFTLMVEQQAQVEMLQSRQAWIEARLEQVFEDIEDAYASRLNPLVDYNIVNPVSALILKGLALG